jgi:hypothetical protein
VLVVRKPTSKLEHVILTILFIAGSENTDKFDQFDEIPPFITSMIKSRIPSANEAPYLCSDHHEKVKNFKKSRPQQKVAK